MKEKLLKKKSLPMIMLELILAVALIGISSGVIIGTPSKVFTKELSLLYELEIERESENLFANLLIDLKNRHNFDSLSSEKKIYPLHPITLNIGDLANQKIGLSYKLWARSTKESNNQTFYKLMGFQVLADTSLLKPKFKLKPPTFTFLVRRSSRKSLHPKAETL